MELHPELKTVGRPTKLRPYPLPTDVPIVVSFGMGVDSMAVLVEFARRGIRPDMVVFAHTGCEKGVTYSFLVEARAWISRVWPGLELTELQYFYKKTCLQSLVQYLLRTEQMPGTAYGTRSCSIKYKGDRIDALVDRTYGDRNRYYRAGGRVIRVIGYDGSEADLARSRNSTEGEAEARREFGRIILPGHRARYARRVAKRLNDMLDGWTDVALYELDERQAAGDRKDWDRIEPRSDQRLSAREVRRLLRKLPDPDAAPEAETGDDEPGDDDEIGGIEPIDQETFDRIQRLVARGRRKGARESWKSPEWISPIFDNDKYVWWYPLQDWGWQREQCVAGIRRTKERGSSVPPIEVPPKSACYVCSSTQPFELLSFILCEPQEAYHILLIEALGLRPDVSARMTSAGIWRKEVVGTEGGIPRPESMSRYILEWMRDGRAYDTLPAAAREGRGLTQDEMARLPHLGRVYLPVLQGRGPDAGELQKVRELGTRVAEALWRQADKDGLLVDGRAVRLSDPEIERRRVAKNARIVRDRIFGPDVCGVGPRTNEQLEQELARSCAKIGGQCVVEGECRVQPMPEIPATVARPAPASPPAPARPVVPPPRLPVPSPPAVPVRPQAPVWQPPAEAPGARFTADRGVDGRWYLTDRRLGIMLFDEFPSEAAARAEAGRRNAGS